MVHGELAIAATVTAQASGRASITLPDKTLKNATLGTLDLAIGPVPVTITADIALKVWMVWWCDCWVNGGVMVHGGCDDEVAGCAGWVTMHLFTVAMEILPKGGCSP